MEDKKVVDCPYSWEGLKCFQFRAHSGAHMFMAEQPELAGIEKAIVDRERRRLHRLVSDLPELKPQAVQSGYPAYWPFSVIRRTDVKVLLSDGLTYPVPTAKMVKEVTQR